MDTRYDPMLGSMLENGIDGYLDIVMSFLYRRTDFFNIMRSKTDTSGFPEGKAADMLRIAFEKYSDLPPSNSFPGSSSGANSVKVVRPTKSSAIAKKPDAAEPTKKAVEDNSAEKTDETPKKEVKRVSDKPNEDDETKVDDHEQEETAEEKQLKKEQKIYQALSDTYNGASRDKYSWSQSIGEIDILVKVPSTVLKGHQVRVKAEQVRLTVDYSVDGQWSNAIDETLAWPVKPWQLVWTLIPKEHHVHVNLDKASERWWDCAFEGESKINVRNIDASRSVGELDSAAQSKVHQLMAEQRQKKMAADSDNWQMNKNQEILKKAWNGKNSPFKGTEFDPSILQNNSSSMGKALQDMITPPK